MTLGLARAMYSDGPTVGLGGSSDVNRAMQRMSTARACGARVHDRSVGPAVASPRPPAPALGWQNVVYSSFMISMHG